MTLRDLRKENNLTQLEMAHLIGIPERTYRRYENDEGYGDNLKRLTFFNIVKEKCTIDETKGLLTIEQIKTKVKDVFDADYPGQIDFCYLFGSYVEGLAKETSDVDLYVSSSLTGLRFVGLIEKLRQALHKKVDLIRSSELSNNIDLVNEIMRKGIKIYDNQKR